MQFAMQNTTVTNCMCSKKSGIKTDEWVKTRRYLQRGTASEGTLDFFSNILRYNFTYLKCAAQCVFTGLASPSLQSISEDLPYPFQQKTLYLSHTHGIYM